MEGTRRQGEVHVMENLRPDAVAHADILKPDHFGLRLSLNFRWARLLRRRDGRSGRGENRIGACCRPAVRRCARRLSGS